MFELGEIQKGFLVFRISLFKKMNLSAKAIFLRDSIFCTK